MCIRPRLVELIGKLHHGDVPKEPVCIALPPAAVSKRTTGL